MNQSQIDTIKQAILNEIEGYEFYQLAATRAATENSKQALLNLANEEVLHVSWLKALFNSLKEGTTNTYDLTMISELPSPQLYDIEMLGDQDMVSAMSVFGIGMQMEKAAVEFYTKAKQESDDDASKMVYSKLIEWEKSHYDQFATAYEQLKSEWWQRNDFTPF